MTKFIKSLKYFLINIYRQTSNTNLKSNWVFIFNEIWQIFKFKDYVCVLNLAIRFLFFLSLSITFSIEV